MRHSAVSRWLVKPVTRTKERADAAFRCAFSRATPRTKAGALSVAASYQGCWHGPRRSGNYNLTSACNHPQIAHGITGLEQKMPACWTARGRCSMWGSSHAAAAMTAYLQAFKLPA